MNISYTLAIVKPAAVQQRHTGAIISKIEAEGFELKALTLVQLTHKEAEAFYAVHKERPFYKDLCDNLAASPLVALALAKHDAVQAFRKLIGATDPAQAAPGTLRRLFGQSIDHNAVHGSDTPANAQAELAFFFPQGRW